MKWEDCVLQRSFKKALDKAALFRKSSNTSAFHVLPDVIWKESGAESPLVEINVNGSVETFILHVHQINDNIKFDSVDPIVELN